MRKRVFSSGLVVMLGLAGAGVIPLAAQMQEYPLGPVSPRSNIVAPYFDGFMVHEDGSRTYSFGFLNRNSDPDAVIEIPRGPDNFIEPARFDGGQPEHFPVVNYPGFGGPRERGAFAVTVPADFDGDVVWTLRNPNGQVTSVPGRASSVAYELSITPQAFGTLRPYVRFVPGGPAGWGPEGLTLDEPLTTAVGVPLTINVMGEDRGARAPTALNVTWYKHQGPVRGTVSFDPASQEMELEGEAANQGTTRATFSEPGRYVLRARVDNFNARDSSFGNACCWSNGYVPVDVTP